MNFFKTLLASCLGSLVAMIVFFLLLVSFLISAISNVSEGEKNVVFDDNSVLHLKLNSQISEMEVENPFEGLPLPGVEEASIGLIQLKNTISYAKTDPRISGIYLDVSMFQGGISKAREIRESLIDFRKSGKWVIAYSEAYSEVSYYLASSADKVFLNPEGDLEFNGLALETMFFKRMFDKLDIKPEIFRVGDFKSAVEPFMLDKMSDANKLQLNELIQGLNNDLVKGVAESRGMEMTELMQISAKAQVTNAIDAQKFKLVDSLMYYDQVQSALRSRLKLEDDARISFVKYNKYKKTVQVDSESKNEIAVIVADGEIITGKAREGTIGSDTFAEELRKARNNKKVKAIVLRINSPGGSALASDVMWREVRLAAEKKPIIASMSTYAASGGYYLAMGCDTIVAQPTTITGSIGVFSVLFDLSGMLNNKIGITFDEVKTGEVGEMVTFSRPLTDLEKSIWQKRTNQIYESFTTKAAEGRHMKVEDLRKIASGRVWTGAQAKENGLVDMLGGFDDAVRVAAQAAGIGNDYKLKYYPKQRSFLETWLNDMEDNARVHFMKQELGEHYDWVQQVQRVKDISGSQARLPFELSIR
jgi:protease-4